MKSITLFKNYFEFLQFFASENIGNEIEIDFERLWDYVSSTECLLDTKIRDEGFSKNDYYKLIEEDIIQGAPIWDFFVLSDWTRNMLRIDFESRIEDSIKEQEEYEKQFLCFKCTYFHEYVASFGVARRCYNETLMRLHRHERCWFSLKKKCKHFREVN